MSLVSVDREAEGFGMTNSESPPKRRSLTVDERRHLFNLVQDQGAHVVARLIGIHPQTLASLTAGFNSHRSTVAHVAHRLSEL